MDIEALVQSTVKNHRESVVIVRQKFTTLDDSKLGTGFVIRSTKTTCLVMTCHHVVETANPSEHTLCVRFCGDTSEYPARILRHHERADLMILQVSDITKEYPVLQFRDTKNIPAETPVFLLGYIFQPGPTLTLPLAPSVSPGKTAQPTQENGPGLTDIVYTSSSTEGSSGGPLILGDRVVGVHHTSLLQIMHARSSETVNSVLKIWLNRASDAILTTEEMIQMLEI